MKIAHVCPFYTPAIGGVKQVVEELAKRQAAMDHEVHVFTSDWDKEKRIKKKEETIDGIKVHRCKHYFKIANFASFWPSVFTKVMKEKFDVVHIHIFAHPHFVLGVLGAKLSGAVCVHTTHCPWSDSYRSIPGRIGLILSYNIFSRLMLNFVDKIIAITPWEIDFIKKYGGSDNQIVIIPNGMDNLFFKKTKPNNFKKKHGIKGKLVLFFGRLSPTKAPDFFVEIAKAILKDRKDVTFVLRGPDEGLKKKVEGMIKNEKKILLLPETRDRKEITEMYQAADVFLLPSYREGLPLTLFEAMASGAAVVATPVNGVPYEIKEPDNGFLVEYGNVEGFKKRTNEFLDNPKLRQKVGKANIEKSKEYRWDIISKKTLDLYDGLLKDKNI